MPKIIFIQPGVNEGQVVDADVGCSLMEVARNAGIAGIPADCGGACICGTCHVWIDAQWQERIGPPTELEEATMEFSDGVQSASRLSCQIAITDDMNGLIVRVPTS
jgi:2Fe-2S ferredoxin